MPTLCPTATSGRSRGVATATSVVPLASTKVSMVPPRSRTKVTVPVSAPAPGAVVSAGFLFDVPVRFDTDRLTASIASFRAGEIPSIPIVEVKA